MSGFTPPTTTEKWPTKSWSGRQEYAWDTSLANANPTAPDDEIVAAALSIYPIGGHGVPLNGSEIIPSELCATGTLISVTLDRGRWQTYTLSLQVTTAAGDEYSWFIALPSQAFAGLPAPIPPQFYFGNRLTWPTELPVGIYGVSMFGQCVYGEEETIGIYGQTTYGGSVYA